MKGKSFIKTLVMILFFAMFMFVDKVSAISFSNKEFEGITTINYGDTGYTKPSSDDITYTCPEGVTCGVEIVNPIPTNVDVAGAYEVKYNVVNTALASTDANRILETLSRVYLVVDNRPVIKTDKTSTTPLANENNPNFNFVINGYGEQSPSGNAGLDLFIGNIQNADLILTLRGLCGGGATSVAGFTCNSAVYNRITVTEVEINPQRVSNSNSMYNDVVPGADASVSPYYIHMNTTIINLDASDFANGIVYTPASDGSVGGGYFARQLIVTVYDDELTWQGTYYLSYYNVEGRLTSDKIDYINRMTNYETKYTEYAINVINATNYAFRYMTYADGENIDSLSSAVVIERSATAYKTLTYTHSLTLDGNETVARVCFVDLVFKGDGTAKSICKDTGDENFFFDVQMELTSSFIGCSEVDGVYYCNVGDKITLNLDTLSYDMTMVPYDSVTPFIKVSFFGGKTRNFTCENCDGVLEEGMAWSFSYVITSSDAADGLTSIGLTNDLIQIAKGSVEFGETNPSTNDLDAIGHIYSGEWVSCNDGRHCYSNVTPYFNYSSLPFVVDTENPFTILPNDKSATNENWLIPNDGTLTEDPIGLNQHKPQYGAGEYEIGDLSYITGYNYNGTANVKVNTVIITLACKDDLGRYAENDDCNIDFSKLSFTYGYSFYGFDNSYTIGDTTPFTVTTDSTNKKITITKTNDDEYYLRIAINFGEGLITDLAGNESPEITDKYIIFDHYELVGNGFRMQFDENHNPRMVAVIEDPGYFVGGIYDFAQEQGFLSELYVSYDGLQSVAKNFWSVGTDTAYGKNRQYITSTSEFTRFENGEFEAGLYDEIFVGEIYAFSFDGQDREEKVLIAENSSFYVYSKYIEATETTTFRFALVKSSGFTYVFERDIYIPSQDDVVIDVFQNSPTGTSYTAIYDYDNGKILDSNDVVISYVRDNKFTIKGVTFTISGTSVKDPSGATVATLGEGMELNLASENTFNTFNTQNSYFGQIGSVTVFATNVNPDAVSSGQAYITNINVCRDVDGDSSDDCGDPATNSGNYSSFATYDYYNEKWQVELTDAANNNGLYCYQVVYNTGYAAYDCVEVTNIDKGSPTVESMENKIYYTDNNGDLVEHYNDTNMNQDMTLVVTVTFSDWIYEGLSNSDITVNYVENATCSNVVVSSTITTIMTINGTEYVLSGLTANGVALQTNIDEAYNYFTIGGTIYVVDSLNNETVVRTTDGTVVGNIKSKQEITISGCGGNGLVNVTVNDNGVITDKANNVNTQSASSEHVAVDNIAPNVALSLVSNTNMNAVATNNTHLNSSHTLTIKVTITDTVTVSNATYPDIFYMVDDVPTSSSNYDAGVEISVSELNTSSVIDTCTVVRFNNDSRIVENGTIEMTYTISGCSGNGELVVSVDASKSIDLARNESNASTNSLNYIIDNLKIGSDSSVTDGDEEDPFELIFVSNTNSIVDTHINNTHTVEYKIVVEDSNLLDNNNYALSSNKNGNKLTSEHIYAKYSNSDESNACTVAVGDIEFISLRKFYQIITLTNCSGSGTLTVYVKENSIYDLADNYNVQSNTHTLIVDNVDGDEGRPEVELVLVENTNNSSLATNNTHINSSHSVTFDIIITDTNLLNETDLEGSSNFDEVLVSIIVGIKPDEEDELTVMLPGSCYVEPIRTTKVSNQELKQRIKISDCSGNGTLEIYVAAEMSIDLAENLSNESNHLIYTVDNSKIGDITDDSTSIVGLEIVSNTNPIDDLYDGKYAYVNKTHTVVYKVTFKDANLLDDVDYTLSSNRNANKLTSAHVFAKIGTSTDESQENACDIEVSDPTVVSLTEFTQLITLSRCGHEEDREITDGLMYIYIMENAIYDIADNYNNASNQLELFIDNTPPRIEIEFDSNTNMQALATNNTHVNSSHSIVFIATISDENLLDAISINGSSNSDEGVLLVKEEISVKFSSSVSNVCEVEMSDAYEIIYEKYGADSFKQKITLTNCSGDGLATIKVLEDSSLDVMGNLSFESNELTFTVDNTAPEIVLSLESNTNSGVNSSFANSADVLVIRAVVTDDNLFDGELSGDTITSNLNAGVLLTLEELTRSGELLGCVFTLTGTEKISNTRLDHLYTITGCSGNGTLQVKIDANKSIDLADNNSNASNVLTYTIDNTLPIVTIVLTETDNTFYGVYRNNHINSSHTVTFTVTIEDANLNTGMITGSNSNQVELEGVSCSSVIIEDVTNTAGKIVQTVKLKGCEGNGTVSIKVIPDSNIKDKADNDILETTTVYTIDNGTTVQQVQNVATVSGATFQIRNGNIYTISGSNVLLNGQVIDTLDGNNMFNIGDGDYIKNGNNIIKKRNIDTLVSNSFEMYSN